MFYNLNITKNSWIMIRQHLVTSQLRYNRVIVCNNLVRKSTFSKACISEFGKNELFQAQMPF